MKLGQEMTLRIMGLGIIMYSDFAVGHIAEGENYLMAHYLTGEQVREHVLRGTIVGFCTRSPGTFILRFRSGYPDPNDTHSFSLRLGIEVRGGRILVRDLYDLMTWTARCPEEQSVALKDGFYHITLCSGRPSSGILGDRQIIYVYLNKLRAMPKLKYSGVPDLYFWDEE